MDQPVISESIPPQPDFRRFWKIYAGFILIVAVCFTFFRTEVQFNSQFKNIPSPTRKPLPTPTRPPVNKYVEPPIPTIPTTRSTPANGTSYGVFFPYHTDKTINNPSPTIIGKTPQTLAVFLTTKFGSEISPVSGDPGNFLRFIPGRTKNLTLKIDGQTIKDVFGIPQYPTIYCVTQTKNTSGTYTIDNQAGQKVPPDIIYTNEKDCLEGKSSELPPLIFFAKPATPLSEGTHTLSVEYQNLVRNMPFRVDSNFVLPDQNIFVVKSEADYQYPLLRSDTCMPGYYYDSNYLKFPLPTFPNSNLVYGLSFPQNDNEKGSINRRRVQIAFEKSRFDLFFPEFPIFYEGKTNITNQISDHLYASEELFLPRNMLVYTDGLKADYQQPKNKYGWASGYFEIYAVDLTGGQYRNSSIPFRLDSSSGCDG